MDVDPADVSPILRTAIRLAGGTVTWRIPHRILDGYGMRDKHIEAAKLDGARLIITADTGTRSFSGSKCVTSAAIDVIVTDHHLPDSDLPDVAALVNPTRRDSAYANRNLCGAGLAFQIAAGLFRVLGMPEKRLNALRQSFIKLQSEPLPTLFRLSARTGHSFTSVCTGWQTLEIRGFALCWMRPEFRRGGYPPLVKSRFAWRPESMLPDGSRMRR